MITTTNSTLAFYSRSALQMGDLRGAAEELQNQLSTGERLSRSSDDPVAASRLRMLDRADQLGEIDTANARRTSDNLQLAASALESMGADLIRVRELALWAASDTVGDSERTSIASELEQLRMRLMDTANALDSGGNALFGGEASGKAYAVGAGGVINYVGSGTSGEIDLGQGQNMARGLTGPEVLSFVTGGVPTDAFAHIAALAAALQGGAADPAAAARDALAGFDDALDSVTRGQTVAGARLAWIDVIQDRQIDQSQSRATQKADTGGVDIAGTMAELQQLLTVLEASQAGFSRLAGLTLFYNI